MPLNFDRFVGLFYISGGLIVLSTAHFVFEIVKHKFSTVNHDDPPTECHDNIVPSDNSCQRPQLTMHNVLHVFVDGTSVVHQWITVEQVQCPIEKLSFNFIWCNLWILVTPRDKINHDQSLHETCSRSEVFTSASVFITCTHVSKQKPWLLQLCFFPL